jgi:L-malate glycosyltransferase
MQTRFHRRTLRVLLFIQSMELGGSEKQCVEIARVLSENGFAVTVGCMRRAGPLRRRIAEAGIPLVEFPVGSLLRPRALLQMWRLVRFIRANRFDVVHANDLYANLFSVPAARLAGVPVIVSSQRDLSNWWWYTPLRRRILRSIQKLSTYLLVNSSAIRSQLINEDGFDPQKIRIVYNGIDVDRYASTAAAESCRALPSSVTKSDTLIAMVANMHTDGKGHPDVIEAARAVCRQRPHVRFLLIGDGEMRPIFEAQARSAGLQESVLFLGHRTDIQEILSRCDIGVLASKAEGLPNAVMEYMAAGLATIATPVGGVPEIIEHGVNGILIPTGSPDALSGEILGLLDDDALRQRIGEAGTDTMRSRFDFACVLSRLMDMYYPALPLPRSHDQRATIAAD